MRFRKNKNDECFIATSAYGTPPTCPFCGKTLVLNGNYCPTCHWKKGDEEKVVRDFGINEDQNEE